MKGIPFAVNRIADMLIRRFCVFFMMQVCMCQDNTLHHSINQ